MTAQTTERFQSFAAFYPYYLQEHTDPTCRRLHFFGTLGLFAVLAGVIISGYAALVIAPTTCSCRRDGMKYALFEMVVRNLLGLTS